MSNRLVKAGVGAIGVALLLAAASSAFAQQTANLKMAVYPPEAYTFVDGQAIGPGNRTVTVAPGNHQVIVANYGFRFFDENVTVEPGHTTTVNAKLEPSGAQVAPGDRGRIQIEIGNVDAGDAAVLLNGKTPRYFVGHVDEFNHNVGVEQELIVPPGTHEVTVTRHNQIIWSGPITVAANQRVIVDISNGAARMKDWPRGINTSTQSMDRFHAGTASATVVIAPVSGSITANPPQINCNEPSKLQWASAETIDAEVTGLSPVATSGEQTVSPRQTTTYDFTATGPGGVHKSSATVTVNPVVVANIEASPAEVRYRRIGDKVIHQESATVNWTASNADAVAVDPYGAVESNGSKTEKITPARTAEGPVDETITYTLKATNACGGAETKTASVHVVGSIEPIPEVMLHSVFFPTSYPLKAHPTLGLLSSQQEVLADTASGFIKYLEYDPEAKLRIEAHADVRGTSQSNQELAYRRAELVKQVLLSNGIAESRIEIVAIGSDQPLDAAAVAELETQNPTPMPEKWAEQQKVNQLAYQRRVDIVLLPKNEESLRFYPADSPDSKILRQPQTPARHVIESQ